MRKAPVLIITLAVGIGIGAGLFAFYITRLMLQRTPLQVDRRPRPRSARARILESPTEE